MEHERLEFLLNRYFDQALLPGEKAEFERALLASSEARDLFWERSRWNSAIRQWAEEEGGRIAPAEEPIPFPQAARRIPTPQPRRPVATRTMPRVVHRKTPATAWPLAAAAALALGFLGWTQWGGKRPAKAMSFATITRLETATWEEGADHRSGDALQGTELKLKSGVAQVDFSRGARVFLEGPARLEILSDNSAALREGKLHATVPPSAHGFRVEAPGFVAVDYGTQFGCAVTPSGAPEVHVFQGSVGVAAEQSTEVRLEQNHAVRLDGKNWDAIAARPDEFVSEKTLPSYQNGKQQLEQWRLTHHELSEHPGMLVHFDFETRAGEDRQTLVNRAPHPVGDTNGRITGAHWTSGRWPGKRALEFNSAEDRVQLSLPGEYPAMTFLASVRVANTDLRRNSLIRSTEEERLGEVHWYVSGNEQLAWSARVAPRGSVNQLQHVFSPPVIRGEALESWIMLTTVFDGNRVTHYLKGVPIGKADIDQPKLLVPGLLDIGNGASTVSPRSEREASANFSGCIDELAILSVPLSAEEIQRLYERDRPAK